MKTATSLVMIHARNAQSVFPVLKKMNVCGMFVCDVFIVDYRRTQTFYSQLQNYISALNL